MGKGGIEEGGAKGRGREYTDLAQKEGRFGDSWFSSRSRGESLDPIPWRRSRKTCTSYLMPAIVQNCFIFRGNSAMDSHHRVQ